MITILILYLILSLSLKRQIGHRWDGSPALPYFTPADFGIKEERFFFYSGKWKLSGSRYLPKEGQPKALVVVFHGIGAGRNAYMRNICEFAKRGFLVYAYDNTGCMESEGTESYGLAHVYNDIGAFYRFLDNDKEAQGLRRFSFGHSWGGYSAMLSTRPCYGVEKAVVLSGFMDEGLELGALAKPLRSRFFQWLIRMYSRIHEKAPINSAVSCLDETRAKVLYMQGLKDPVVTYESSGKLLSERYGKRSNFAFRFHEGREHGLDLTQEACNYLESVQKAGLEKLNADPKLKLEPYKATEFDPDVLKATFDFLSL